MREHSLGSAMLERMRGSRFRAVRALSPNIEKWIARSAAEAAAAEAAAAVVAAAAVAAAEVAERAVAARLCPRCGNSRKRVCAFTEATEKLSLCEAAYASSPQRS
jgi:crotonobetainyl-CoA:carnitine CoA-transferase CaiB-like acyl-CoA transferase